jgi:hypothetical protein
MRTHRSQLLFSFDDRIPIIVGFITCRLVTIVAHIGTVEFRTHNRLGFLVVPGGLARTTTLLQCATDLVLSPTTGVLTEGLCLKCCVGLHGVFTPKENNLAFNIEPVLDSNRRIELTSEFDTKKPKALSALSKLHSDFKAMTFLGYNIEFDYPDIATPEAVKRSHTSH